MVERLKRYEYSCEALQSWIVFCVPLTLCLALNIPKFKVQTPTSCVSGVRAENGPESRLKWGAVVYKKLVRLCREFYGQDVDCAIQIYQILMVDI